MRSDSVTGKRGTKESIVLGVIIAGVFLFFQAVALLFPAIITTWDMRIQDQLFKLRFSLFGRGKTSPYLVNAVFTDSQVLRGTNSSKGRETDARLIGLLHDAGVSVIGYDIFFEQPALSDDAFVRAAGSAGNVCQPIVLFQHQTGEKTIVPLQSDDAIPPGVLVYPKVKRKGFPVEADEVLFPFDDLAKTARSFGHINMVPDTDGVIRKVPLVYQYRDGFIPSLPLAMLCDFLDIKPDAVEIDFGSALVLKNAAFPGGLKKDIRIPVDVHGMTRLDFIAPWQKSFYEYPVKELLKAETNPGLKRDLLDVIEGAMVLVSDISVRNRDKSPGVFDPVYPNAEIHSTLINMVLTGSFVYEAHPALTIVVVILMAAALWAGAIVFRSRVFYLSAVLAFICFTTIVVLAFFAARTFLPVVSIVAGFVCALVASGMYLFFIEERASLHFRLKADAAETVNREFEKLNNAKNRFLGYITHDLKNPLAPIKGLLPVLQTDIDALPLPVGTESTVSIKEKFFLMQRSADKLESYIDELLDLVRIDAGTCTPSFTRSDLIVFVRHIAEQFRIQADEKKIAFAFSAPAGELQLWFDRAKLDKVISNLLANALKFTPECGNISITISAPVQFIDTLYPWKWDRNKPEKVVRISVKDTGVGIDEADAAHIFKPFRTGSISGTGTVPDQAQLYGAGIGLALVKEYTELHFGYAGCISKKGDGAEFFILLPEGDTHLLPEEKHLQDENTIRVSAKKRETDAQSHQSLKKEKWPSAPILIIDDDEDQLASYVFELVHHGINHIITESDSRKIRSILEQNNDIAACILDLHMKHVSGMELITGLTGDFPYIPVIIVTAVKSIESAVYCLKKGVFDYLQKPADSFILANTIRHAVVINRLQKERESLCNTSALVDGDNNPFRSIITKNREMYRLFHWMKTVAPSDEHILVRGESGVGKELFAEAIHRASNRQGEYVTANIAGFDDTLFSDTLFGHKKGAYSGALDDRDGLLKKASRGTIFLDEIGELEPKSQVKLLRVLESGEYYPLGSDKPEQLSARIITATNADLEKKIAEGTFRKDLKNRLSVIEVMIPPLRERSDDILELFDFFFKQAAAKFRRNNLVYDLKLIPYLKRYNFPGNIRELKNMVTQAVSKHKSSQPLGISAFRQYLSAADVSDDLPEPGADGDLFNYNGSFPTLDAMEYLLALEAVKRRKNRSSAAELLGIDRFKLGRILKKHRK